MVCWVAKNSKFPVDKWRFDKTDPNCSVALLKSNVFLLIYCKLDKFHYPESIVIHGVSAYERALNKKKIQSSF